MRFATSLLPALAAALIVGVPAAQAQTADKSQQPTAAPAKTQGTTKAATAQAQPKATAATGSKASTQDAATMRTTPAGSKKDASGCLHGGASDA